MDSMAELRCELEQLGFAVDYKMSRSQLRSEVARRRAFVAECEQAQVSSAWDIVILVPDFWAELGDFRYMCMLACVCKSFARGVPTNRVAWEAITAQLPCMSARTLCEIFRVPRYLLTTNGAHDMVLPTEAMQISFHLHGGPKGLYRKRMAVDRVRKQRQRRVRVVWPRFVSFQRLLPVMLSYVKARRWIAGSWAGSFTVSHGDFYRDMSSSAYALYKMRVSESMLYHFMHFVGAGQHIAGRVWQGRQLYWYIKPDAFVRKYYPYTAERIRRG